MVSNFNARRLITEKLQKKQRNHLRDEAKGNIRNLPNPVGAAKSDAMPSCQRAPNCPYIATPLVIS